MDSAGQRLPSVTRGYEALQCMVFRARRRSCFLKSFGEGLFSNRTHGLYIAHDDSLTGGQTDIEDPPAIQKFTPRKAE